MSRWWTVLGLLALVVVLGELGTAVARPAQGGWDPPGDTVVKVTGDAAHGFTIFHKDGTTVFPPTRSEALAECSEYDARVPRVRCRTEVRIWYRDLSRLKRAINWARYSSRTG